MIFGMKLVHKSRAAVLAVLIVLQFDDIRQCVANEGGRLQVVFCL